MKVGILSKFRTLIRLENVSETHVEVILPGWVSKKLFNFQSEMPIIDNFNSGQPRCHAQVNLGVEHKEDLQFEGWEFT